MGGTADENRATRTRVFAVFLDCITDDSADVSGSLEQGEKSVPYIVKVLFPVSQKG
jgi:hypothetical protein